jgi:parvulin-like peptidyl-prolyl isomerase
LLAGILNIRRLSKTFLKPVVIIIVLAMLVGVFYAFPRLGGVNQQVLYQGPSARVNGVKIEDRDFNEIFLRYLQQYGAYLSEDQMKASTLEYLIEKELIKQEIKKRKISVSDQEVEALLNEIKAYNQIDSEEEMEMLIYQTGAGDLKGLQKMLHEILAEQKLYTVLGKEANLEVPEEEIIASYEQLEAAHILIATSSDVSEEPLSDKEALKKAEEIYEKLQAGANFADLAKEYSDDLGNKDQGGRLGRAPIEYFKNAFVPEFVEAALQLNVGEYSAPVKTQFGYHLITLLEKKLAQGEKWEQEKEKIKEDLLANKFLTTKKNEWVQDQRQKHAKIEILDPSLLGYHLVQEGKWAEATIAYENALKDKRYKKNLNTFLALAEAYKETNQYEAALGVFERLPKDLKDNYNVDLAKADVYQSKGDKDGLKAALSAAEAKAGEDITLLNQILNKMKAAELTEETEALAEKIAALQRKIQEEQEALNRKLEEEQNRLQAELNQEGIIETPEDEE